MVKNITEAFEESSRRLFKQLKLKVILRLFLLFLKKLQLLRLVFGVWSCHFIYATFGSEVFLLELMA
jgi:hypothetical protein